MLFGKGKLLREGATTRAVIIDEYRAAVANDGNSHWLHLTLRATFDDDSTQEFKEKIDRRQTGMFLTGDILPVRYDPDDHSKIQVDVPALKAKLDAETAEAKKNMIARGEAELKRDS